MAKETGFNIRLARRISAGVKKGVILTSYGRPVRIVCWDVKCPGLPLLGLIRMADDAELCVAYTKDGTCLKSGRPHPDDLHIELDTNV